MNANNAKINSALYDILRAPVITEKTHGRTPEGKYTFAVSFASSKNEIKEAIEKIFGVEVVKVNTLIREGKTKRFRGNLGKRKNVKFAIVTLAEGQSIEIEGMA